MRKYFVILVLALCSVGTLKGQTASDSLAIVSAQWEIIHAQKGIIHKSASIPQLYQCPQVINLIEIDPGHRLARQRIHDKRHRHQRQKLIKTVHRKHVSRHGDSQCHAVCRRIEQIKNIFMHTPIVFMFHIRKRVERCKRPERRDKPAKHNAHAVYLQ